MTDAGIVFYQLEKRAQYALNSHSRDLVYETYGAAKMARQLQAITARQFDRLNECWWSMASMTPVIVIWSDVTKTLAGAYIVKKPSERGGELCR